jgi:glutamine amidotransferase-like uncharacterized protein
MSKTIIIYVDQGVSGEALRQTVKSLQQEVDLSVHSLVRKDSKQILHEPWQQDACLFLMPGGRDVHYHSALSGSGTEKIKRFVENGGAYLGLCAGAYFAAEAIEFEKGGKLQVCGKRDLELFPGVAIGPAYGLGKYSYESDQGVEAAQISWENEECFTYFNGGCYFEGAQGFSNVSILSSYMNLEASPAAIISCKVGKGTALLSGVHIEFSAQHLQRGSAHFERIYPMLEKSEEKRRAIFRNVLKKLGVTLKG